MGRKKTGLDRRILATADQLFYKQGYTNTGIHQLVTEAGTNKPGLYSYFESKEEIARLYVCKRNDEIVREIEELAIESTDILDFMVRWLRHGREYARGKYGSYNGCAVANFAMQTDQADQAMLELVKKITRRWQAALVTYIRAQMKAGQLQTKNSAASLARRMLICYQGSITMWKVTGNLKYYDEAIHLCESGLLTKA